MKSEISDKSFGLQLSSVLFLLSVLGLIFGWNIRIWMLLLFLSLLTFTVAVKASKLLNPLATFWMSIANLLGKFFSPIVLGLIFIVIVVPIAIIGRIMGRDELGISQKSKDTYWVERVTKFSWKESFKNQF